MQITESVISRIESAFGFQLYDWQRKYLKGEPYEEPERVRRCGRTFIHIVRLLLSDGESIKWSDVKEGRYLDSYHGQRYVVWFSHELLEINEVLISHGFRTRFTKEHHHESNITKK